MRRTHRVIKIGGGEVGAAELQLGHEAHEKYAALLYRQAIGGRPDSSKLRIRQSEHAANGLVGAMDVNFFAVGATVQGGGKRRAGLATIAYSWPPPLVELGGQRPTDHIFFCIRTPLNRRLVGAINIFVVFLLRIRAVFRMSWQSLYVPPLLSGSGSHHLAPHGAIPSEVANLSYLLPVC